MTNCAVTGGVPSILVVEDNYLTASAICDIVRECGFAVAGAVGRLSAGLEFLAEHEVDGAIIDVNLDGTLAFPLCTHLERRNVPYWFLTGQEPSIIPPAFRSTPLLAKPANPIQIRSALSSLRQSPAATVVPLPRPAPERGNALLRALADEDRLALEPAMEHVALRSGDILEDAGLSPSHLIFPLSGIVSLEWGTGSDRLQVALVGPEGMVGTSLLLGPGPAVGRAAVLYEGRAIRISSAAAKARLAQSERLRDVLLRSAGSVLAQVSSNALAAGRATIEQRIARWLLMVSARLATNEVALTHETAARVLGVRRAGVTVALHVLEGKQALRSTRGRVRILDHSRLAALAGKFHDPSN
jgi:CRP-like cAMP-binding protein/CheY-like chemotaxis protein